MGQFPEDMIGAIKIKDGLFIRTDLSGISGCVESSGTSFSTTTPATINHCKGFCEIDSPIDEGFAAGELLELGLIAEASIAVVAKLIL
jgi:hypothetical protein